jgi:hypothetical protein
MTQPGPPAEISCIRCGQRAELTAEKVVYEAFGGFLLQALASIGSRWRWKYRCANGHEESLRAADRRLNF